MKKITSYILLFIYANGLLAPVSPIVNDALAHIFWRAEHMATIHCVNGQFHVHYELYKESTNGNKDKSSSVKSDEAFPIHLMSQSAFTEFTFWSNTLKLKDKTASDNPFIRINAPPPKAA
jgi:hypothetical protein